MGKQEIYALLAREGIAYEAVEHKAVFNMEELADVALPHPEADAKNLFVRDDKRRDYYLITVRGDKRVDLKQFRRDHGTRALTFAHADELDAMLGLIPGAVTPLGLLNEKECRVKLFLDADLVAGGLIGVHPNDNTASVFLKTEDLVRLIEGSGHEVEVVTI